MKGNKYAPFNEYERVLIRSKKSVYVPKTLDNALYLVDGDDIWPLIDMHTMTTPLPAHLKDRIWVPGPEHPWKEAGYKTLIKKLRKVA
ncbi:MAG: hypothetical protein LBC35_06655 [Coriobacteriales bacterium]|jgi:hypothetical protein|nr:hypothetical protein [Coriobacteriales bacterium]